MKSALLFLVCCFIYSATAHSVFVLPRGFPAEGSQAIEPSGFVSYLLHGTQPQPNSVGALSSLLQKPSANALFTVHSPSLDLATVFPQTYAVISDRAVRPVETESHDCPFAAAMAQDKSATTFMTPAPSCTRCEASSPATCSLSYSAHKGFTNVNGDFGHVNKEELQQKLASDLPFGKGIEVDAVNNVVVVAVTNSDPISLDLTDDVVAEVVYHSVLLTMLPSLLLPVEAPLLSVLADVNMLQTASEKFGKESPEFAAVSFIVDRALSMVIPQLEEQYAARGMTTELLVMDCVGESHTHATEVQNTATLSRRTLATSSSSSAAGNSTLNYNTVGSEQILIWLTVGLVLLVALGGYVMTACGVEATKDTLLYTKTTTYH